MWRTLLFCIVLWSGLSFIDAKKSSSPPYSALNWNTHELFTNSNREVVFNTFSSVTSYSPCLHGMVDSMLLAYYSGQVLELSPSDLFWLILQGFEYQFGNLPVFIHSLNRTTLQRNFIEQKIKNKTWKQLIHTNVSGWQDRLDLLSERFYKSFYSSHQSLPCPVHQIQPSYLRELTARDERLQNPPGYLRIGLTSHNMSNIQAGIDEWDGLYTQLLTIQTLIHDSLNEPVPLWLKQIQICLFNLKHIFPSQGDLKTRNETLHTFLYQVLYPVGEESRQEVTGWFLSFFPQFVNRTSVYLWEFPSGLLQREFTWSRPALTNPVAKNETMISLFGWAPAKLFGNSQQIGWRLASSPRCLLVQRVYENTVMIKHKEEL